MNSDGSSASSDSDATSKKAIIHASEGICLPRHTSEILVCGWGPGVNILASGSGEGFKIWDILDHSTVIQLGTPKPKTNHAYIACLEWNEQATSLATSSHGVVNIWSSFGGIRSTFKGHEGPIYCLKWNKMGKNTQILTGSSDRTARVWDCTTSHLVQHFPHSTDVVDVDWISESEFVTCSKDRTLRVFTVGVPHPTMNFHGHTGIVNAIKWNQTESLLASGSNDKTVKIWSKDQNDPLLSLEKHEQEINVIEWSPADSNLLVSGASDSTLKLWDMENAKLRWNITRPWDCSISTVAFNPDGHCVANGENNVVSIFSVKEGKCIRSYHNEQSGGAAGICWSKDGNQLAVGFKDGEICILNFRM